jgi:hypothetical protein
MVVLFVMRHDIRAAFESTIHQNITRMGNSTMKKKLKTHVKPQP